MGKRKHEEIEPSTAGTSLQEHLAAEQARENAPRSRRHQELRPAVPSLSPITGLDHMFPSVGGSSYNLTDEDEPSGTRAKAGHKKELSTTKRAKQNRDAQRAFRERKAGHIQELEDKVNRLQAVTTAHKMLQIENESLRDYVSNLQTTLISSSIEVPDPPLSLALSRTPAPRRTFAPTTGRHFRATSLEVQQISDAALMRQREGEVRERRGHPPLQTQNGRSTNDKPNGMHPPVREPMKDSNIEPSLLEQSRRAAAQAV